jgi:hypothetical protein
VTDAPTRELDWESVWVDVAHRLAEHRAAGRTLLLTEDSVRWCTVLALEAVGVSPDRLAIEVQAPVLAGGKLDLTVDGADGTVIELKYPRASRSGISPDTMTLGELIRDFLRVALVEAQDRWVVQVLEPELRRYLGRRQGLGWPTAVGEPVAFTRDVLEALPRTALDAIGSLPWRLPLTATCVVAAPIDVDLALFAFRVNAPESSSVATPLAASVAPETRRGASPAKRGARSEILDAIGALVGRSGRVEVTIEQVVDELRRTGSSYADSTIRTMMSSHMCAQAHGSGIGTYDDLDRVDRGHYRLRHTAHE